MTPNESECSDYFLSLNESQKEAVKSALGGGVLSLIQGPPGTGKTQVITEICLQLYRQNPDVRILVCSEPICC
jgi:superfamily I DNA and RNA helicase